MMATHGCQLPQFKVEDMTLFFNSHVLNTHATILILESSPFLETFTIHGSQYGEVSFLWFSFSNLIKLQYVCLFDYSFI